MMNNTAANEVYKNKILVIGDIMLDQYIIGKTTRLCPEVPVPIVSMEEERWFLGGAASAAANIQMMGGQALLAGVVGMDDGGTRAQRMLKSLGIPLVLSVDSSRPTTIKQRIISREQLIVQIDRESRSEISEGTFQDMIKIITVMSDDINLVVICDHGNGVVTNELMNAIIHICLNRNILVYISPDGNNYEKYRGVAVLNPTFSSLENFYGKDICTIDDMENVVDRIFEITDCKHCIVTWDKNGAVLFNSPKDWIHIPGYEGKETICISGAKDAFLAFLAMGETAGFSLEISSMIANRLVFMTIDKTGTMQTDEYAWRRAITSILPTADFI